MEEQYKYLDNYPLSEKDLVEADLQNITVMQAQFNVWFNYRFHFHGGEYFLDPPVKMSKVKCLGWKFLPESILGCKRECFKGWTIGHCLNCNADPYDCVSLAWQFDAGGYHGALLKCGKCGQLRWQPRKVQ